MLCLTKDLYLQHKNVKLLPFLGGEKKGFPPHLPLHMLVKVTFSLFREEKKLRSVCPGMASRGCLHQRRSLPWVWPRLHRGASPGRFAGSRALPRRKKDSAPWSGFLILPNTSRQQMHQQEAALLCKWGAQVCSAGLLHAQMAGHWHPRDTSASRACRSRLLPAPQPWYVPPKRGARANLWVGGWDPTKVDRQQCAAMELWLAMKPASVSSPGCGILISHTLKPSCQLGD